MTGTPGRVGIEGMIRYEVTLDVDPAVAPVDAVERYMRDDHIPAIHRTGCFARIRFERAAPTRFRTAYEARTQEDLDRYLREHTERLREDFQAHFPRGVAVSREVWRELEQWGGR